MIYNFFSKFFDFSLELKGEVKDKTNINNLLYQAKALARNFRDSNRQLELERNTLRVFYYVIFFYFFYLG